MMNTPRRSAYFISIFNRTKDGQYVPCIAVEGEPGYHKTDWAWGKDKEIAEEICARKNKDLGLSHKDVLEIILSSMGAED